MTSAHWVTGYPTACDSLVTRHQGHRRPHSQCVAISFLSRSSCRWRTRRLPWLRLAKSFLSRQAAGSVLPQAYSFLSAPEFFRSFLRRKLSCTFVKWSHGCKGSPRRREPSEKPGRNARALPEHRPALPRWFRSHPICRGFPGPHLPAECDVRPSGSRPLAVGSVSGSSELLFQALSMAERCSA